VSIAPEMLFLPAKDPAKEKWNGARLSPTDPDVQARTGFASVIDFASMRTVIEHLVPSYPNFLTILPYNRENGGYPHEKQVQDWLALIAPQAKLADVRGRIETLRQIKSRTELEFLQRAIDL
jgi:Xaa-Pro aminopeptidase